MNSSINEPKFQKGDRVKLSPEGIAMKGSLLATGRKPRTPWKDRRGAIQGRPAIHKNPLLWTVKWDDRKGVLVYHERFLEHAKETIQEAPARTDGHGSDAVRDAQG